MARVPICTTLTATSTPARVHRHPSVSRRPPSITTSPPSPSSIHPHVRSPTRLKRRASASNSGRDAKQAFESLRNVRDRFPDEVSICDRRQCRGSVQCPKRIGTGLGGDFWWRETKALSEGSINYETWHIRDYTVRVLKRSLMLMLQSLALGSLPKNMRSSRLISTESSR